MIFTSQLGTKPSYLTPPLAPLTPLSHTKANSPRPGGGGGKLKLTEYRGQSEKERQRGEKWQEKEENSEAFKEGRWCVKSKGTCGVDGGGVEWKAKRV